MERRLFFSSSGEASNSVFLMTFSLTGILLPEGPEKSTCNYMQESRREQRASPPPLVSVEVSIKA